MRLLCPAACTVLAWTYAAQRLEIKLEGKPPNAEIGIGFLSALHCHLGNIVARVGRAIRFDAKTETIIGDAEANRLLAREYREHWGKPKGV